MEGWRQGHPEATVRQHRDAAGQSSRALHRQGLSRPRGGAEARGPFLKVVRPSRGPNERVADRADRTEKQRV